MNRRVLVVAEDVSELTEILSGFETRYVHGGREALQVCAEAGPFAAVVAADELGDMGGVSLLSRMKERWPDTVRLLVTGHSTLETAIQALHEGAIFRFLRRPLERGLFCDALESGLDRYRQVETERLFTEQLQFSRESLLTLTETLERRLAEQVTRVQGLQSFHSQLGQAASIEEIARLAAEASSLLLGGRGVRVELALPGAPTAEGAAGPELAGDRHRQDIATADGPLGSLFVDRSGGTELQEQDLEFLASLAATTGIAARNQLHRLERDDAQHATIFALAGLAEYRDDETGRHLERVSEYCRLIASELALSGPYCDEVSEAFIEDLVLSAPLHDIGKVGIPDAILLKPGKLTEDEWEVMRRHTTIGAETLLNALETGGERGFLRMGHDVALCHHERWDGSGYPHGATGTNIPLSARIMSVADCYDALTTWRPYKEPWSHDDSVAYIRAKGGSQFDPFVVEAFLQRVEAFNRVRRTLADEVPSGTSGRPVSPRAPRAGFDAPVPPR